MNGNSWNSYSSNSLNTDPSISLISKPTFAVPLFYLTNDTLIITSIILKNGVGLGST